MPKVKIYFEDLSENQQANLKREIRDDIIAGWWSGLEDKGTELSDDTLTQEEDEIIDDRVENYIRQNDIGCDFEI